MKRYDLSYSQEQVVVDYIKGNISGSVAAKRLKISHRQGFVNMFASIIQQWHEEGRLYLTINSKIKNKVAND